MWALLAAAAAASPQDSGPGSALLAADPGPDADDVQVVFSNPQYRVSDVVKHCGNRWDDSAIAVNASSFEGSLLYDYLQRQPNTDEWRSCTASDCTTSNPGSAIISSDIGCADMDLLTQLVSEQASKERVLPGPDDVVVHIRSGDVRPEIDEVIATVQSLQPIKGALTVVTAMAFQTCTPDQNCVTGVGTWGYNDTMVDQSRTVLQSLFEQLETVDAAKLQLVSHGAAEGATDRELAAAVDKDLVYMSAARTFLRSSGGFSELIAMLVERQNGIQLRAGTVHPR